MRSPAFLRMRSFRLRIALLSVLVSGVALGVFGSLTLEAMDRLSLQRMDEDIKQLVHKHLVEAHGPGHWERVSDSLGFFLGDEDKTTFIMLVKDRDGAVKFVSPNWPKEFSTDEYLSADAWGRYPDRVRPRQRARPNPQSNRRDNGANTGRQDAVTNPSGVPPETEPPLKSPEFSTRQAGGIQWRIGVMGTSEITIVLGLNMRRLTAETAQVRHAILMVLPIALLFVGIGAWWISQRALKPIKAVTGAIQQVKAKGLDQRVANQDEDHEFSELIAVFNDMMDWLEKSFHQAIRFSADASHELKTPLTVLQAQLERAVHEAESGSDEQRRYVAIAKELQRLKSITQKLLLLSRIDAGELKLNLRPLNLSQFMEGVVEDTETLAQHLTVESELVPDLWVMADSDLMKQVVQNLTSNAIKYNEKGGFIRLNLVADAEKVRLDVTNSGKGISSEDRDKVFTRFYRGDKARTRRVSGAGLGLSLAREIVRAHHGELVFAQGPDASTVFSVILPRTIP